MHKIDPTPGASPLPLTRPDPAIRRPQPAAGSTSAPRKAGLLRRIAVSVTCVAAVAGLQPMTASAQSAPQATSATPEVGVRVTTNMGQFVIELNPDRAPLTVRNFLRYVNEGFYTNTLFHRVVSNFVVQGGGYDATTLKLKPTHEDVFNESGNGLQNTRGTVGMARSNPPHSGNSQFYVNLADNTDLDPLPTRWGYAVFGKVVEGMEVLEKIGVVATGSNGPFKSDAPLKPIVIEKIEPLGKAATFVKPAAPAPAPGAKPAETQTNGRAGDQPDNRASSQSDNEAASASGAPSEGSATSPPPASGSPPPAESAPPQ